MKSPTAALDIRDNSGYNFAKRFCDVSCICRVPCMRRATTHYTYNSRAPHTGLSRLTCFNTRAYSHTHRVTLGTSKQPAVLGKALRGDPSRQIRQDLRRSIRPQDARWRCASARLAIAMVQPLPPAIGALSSPRRPRWAVWDAQSDQLYQSVAASGFRHAVGHIGAFKMKAAVTASAHAIAPLTKH